MFDREPQAKQRGAQGKSLHGGHNESFLKILRANPEAPHVTEDVSSIGGGIFPDPFHDLALVQGLIVKFPLGSVDGQGLTVTVASNKVLISADKVGQGSARRAVPAFTRI